MKIKDFSPHIFWSYNKQADLEPEVVIKQVITYGEVSDKVLLVKKIGKPQIVEVIDGWKNCEKYEKQINFMQKVILAK
jgi:hypothetical protein